MTPADGNAHVGPVRTGKNNVSDKKKKTGRLTSTAGSVYREKLGKPTQKYTTARHDRPNGNKNKRTTRPQTRYTKTEAVGLAVVFTRTNHGFCLRDANELKRRTVPRTVLRAAFSIFQK